MKRLSIIIFVLMVCAYVPAYSLLSEGTDAPDFTLADIHGVEYSLSDFAGDVVLLDFFNMSCQPCHKMAAFLERVYGDYKDQGFTIFGIDIDGVNDTLEDVQFYATQYGWSFPTFWDQLGVVPSLYDYNGNLPTTYIIGKDGKIFKAVEGFHEERELRDWIEEALNAGQEERPRITVTTDKVMYTMFRDRMEVYLSVTNPGSVLEVNVVFALYHVPTGSLVGKLWFFPEWTENFQFVRVVLPANLIITEAKVVDIPVPSLEPRNPPVNEAGEYIWAAAFYNPESIEPFSEVSTATVQVVSAPMEYPQVPGPVITVSTDKEEYTWGQDKMEVYLELDHPGEALTVDVVFALYHVPMGSILGKLWFFPTWTERYQAIRVTLPPKFSLPKTKVLDLNVPPDAPGSPPINETGEYIWATALAEPDTFNFIGDISTAPVMINEPIPRFPQEPSRDLIITVSTDKDEYIWNDDRMEVYLELENPGEGVMVDVIFALYHVPTGSIIGKLWFFPDWTETFQAIRVPIPPEFTLPKTMVLQIEVPPTAVPGQSVPPITEPGEYIWATALAKPGVLELITEVSTAPVLIKETMIPGE